MRIPGADQTRVAFGEPAEPGARHGAGAIALRAAQGVTVCLAAVATGVFAYVVMFSQFQGYDDEGYVMLSLKKFLDGMPLYDQTFSQYGPFYYLFQKLLFAIIGVPVAHDVTRLVTIVLWMATAIACAGFIHRQTKSFNWALVAYLHTLLMCRGLVGEPGHPQGLLLLLVMLVVLVAGMLAARNAGFVAIGVLVGFTTLTKVNLGVYVACSVSVAFLALSGPTRAARAAFAAAGAAAIILPFAVMRSDLTGSIINYALIASLSIAACCVTAWRPQLSGYLRPTQLALSVAAFIVTLVVIAASTVLLGTSPSALIDAVVIRPVRFASAYSAPWLLPSRGVVLGALSATLALTLACVRHTNALSDRLLQAVDLTLKLSFGVLAAGASITGQAWMVPVAPLLWVALLPATPGPWPLERLFPRMVLCMVAALQLLVAYPVAGNQQAWATFLLVPASIISMADAVAVIASRIRWPIHRIAEAVLLMLVVYWYQPYFPTGALLRQYSSLTPLALPGAQRIRLPSAAVAVYREITAAIDRDCDTFVTMPGLNSFYFWTRKEPPTGLNATAWMTLFDDQMQQRIVDRFAEHRFGCVIYDEGFTRAWLNGRAVDERPLVKYIRASFYPVRTIGNFQLMVRKDRKWQASAE